VKGERTLLGQWTPWGIKVAVVWFLFLTGPLPIRASAMPNLKTADAVYEKIDKTYQVHRDGSYCLTLHYRVRVLTYKGKKDHADFRYPYNTTYQTVRVESAKTITVDGKILPVDEKEIHDINDPEDAVASIYSQEHMKVVNFPSVEPGTTVELTLKVESKRGFWATECFKLGDPVIQKVVTVSLPKGMPLKIKLPALKIHQEISHRKGRTIYRWIARNRPKQIEEPMLPPMESRGSCLFLSTFSDWSDVAAFFRRMLPKIPAKTEEREFRTDSPDQLYIHLMKRFLVYPLDIFHTSLKFQPPALTQKKGYGSQVDLAALFYGLLKSRGYHPAFFMMNTDGVFLKDFEKMPIPSLFNDILVRCRGVDYAFFAKELPPGYNGLQGERVLDLKHGKLVPSRQRYVNRSVSRLTFILTTASTLKGHFILSTEGRPAMLVRSWLRYKTKNEWRIAASQIYHEIDPIARSEGKLRSEGLDTLTAPVVLKGSFVIPRSFPVNGDWLFVNIRKPDLPEDLETLLSARCGPLMISRDETLSLTMKISLPLHVKVLRFPQPLKGSTKAMDWDYEMKSSGNRLTVHRVIHVKRSILFPGTPEYRAFIRVLTKLYRPSNRLIVLERIPEH